MLRLLEEVVEVPPSSRALEMLGRCSTRLSLAQKPSLRTGVCGPGSLSYSAAFSCSKAARTSVE